MGRKIKIHVNLYETIAQHGCSEVQKENTLELVSLACNTCDASCDKLIMWLVLVADITRALIGYCKALFYRYAHGPIAALQK